MNDEIHIDHKQQSLFEDFNLRSGLLLGLYAMGFQNGPSDIQMLTLPYSLSDQIPRNMIVQSKTGTGKTISYIIHVLARIQPSTIYPQILIMVPTVELAFTVGSGIEKMSTYLDNIQIAYAIPSTITKRLFTAPIVITTIDAFDSCRSCMDLNQLHIVIIDEIDTMIIREDYRRTITDLIDRVFNCQILIYSSTLSEQIMNFTNELVPNSIVIKQKRDRQQTINIEQYFLMCENENEKENRLQEIVKHFRHGQMMIFCLDDQTTHRIYEKLFEQQIEVRILTTQLDDQQRVAIIEEFRCGTFRVFILSAETHATTHGIDLDNVGVVINYDMPRSLGINADLDYVTYHQRLDRCGRYDKHGYLFNLIQTLDDWNIQLGQQDYFSFIIQPIDIDGIRTLV